MLRNIICNLNKFTIEPCGVLPKRGHTAGKEIQYFWKENCKNWCTGQGKVRFYYPAMYFLACAEKSIF